MIIPIADLEGRFTDERLLSGEATLPADALVLFEAVMEHLESGRLRAARKDDDGRWYAVPWVKRAILLGFRLGRLASMDDGRVFSFVDKHTYPVRRFDESDQVRIVPGGSTVRRGAYLAPGVVCMPPMYVNVGAWVGSGSMIDSHALVGSCAQVGERVHLSAAAQIGGVLEPINASPVVIEDDVVVGGNSGVYEGCVVRSRAVIAAGVILTRGTPVYDLVNETVHRASDGQPLIIPEGAVVVPGARKVSSEFGERIGLSLQTPVIVKYRDERTDASTALEAWLR